MPLYNVYEGLPCARQLSETVDEFLQRLPPATTQQSILLPWIFIANPYIPNNRKQVLPSQAPAADLITEAPPEPESDVRRFREMGTALLEELTRLKQHNERKYAGQPATTVTREIDVRKTQIVQKILDAAQETHVRSGKVRHYNII